MHAAQSCLASSKFGFNTKHPREKDVFPAQAPSHLLFRLVKLGSNGVFFKEIADKRMMRDVQQG